MARNKDPWADRPDRFDRADREWREKWTDTPAEDEEAPEAPPADYQNEKVTADRVRDAYGDGMLAAGPHLGFGMQLAAAMVFFVGVGIVADRYFGTTPWGVLIGAALGMVGVFAMVVRLAREANAKGKRPGGSGKGP
ncbi:AtpZ/AtpI family protein [Rubrivirga sp. IMCC45206]|uniref:AtpZ/AtpI family protein n=1 Tax=Rubrivirga sp. IMCC45206 TaxID=3391614 RepID=UPI00398FE41C